MATLLTLQGPDSGRTFPVKVPCTVIGRQFDTDVCLAGKAVSRQHAQLLWRENQFCIEDLGSSNGTFVNGQRLNPHQPTPLGEADTLQIGPYLFALRVEDPTPAEPSYIVRESLNARSLNESVFGQDPAQKLQVVVEIAQHLSRTLDLEPLLDKLLDHVLRLLPQTDRGMVLLCEGDKLVVRAQKCRGEAEASEFPYSRTIVRKALDEGMGLLSEDVHADSRFQASQTLTRLDMRSLMCVPLLGHEGARLGVLQVDRFRRGAPFRVEDLQLLTAVGWQVSVALENAALHAERLREQRLHQELAMAREIQQGFLPQGLDGIASSTVELFAQVFPAREVAGDLYDFLRMADGRIAFYIGDVSGKGMPAALFMVAVHTLARHLAKEDCQPSRTLYKLNSALAADNPSGMFVTLGYGCYSPGSGAVVLSCAGHPSPLLRHADGRVEEISLPPGRLLGFDENDIKLHDTHVTLVPGDALIFFTDGVTEARAPESRELFGLARLQRVVEGLPADETLARWAERIQEAIALYTGTRELQDDVTLLLLRHKGT